MNSLNSAPERFLLRPARAIRVGGALIGVVALMAVLVPAAPLGIDLRWSEAMQDIRTPLLTNLALVFNALGRGLGLALSLAALGIVLAVSRRWVALAAFALTETLTPLSSTLFKIVVGRARPPDGLVHPVGSSFPSGHAAYAGATCIALVLLFTVPGPRRRLWWALATLGTLGMAWSRTYLQVHWLSDVIAGSLLGIGISLAVFGGAQATADQSDRLGSVSSSKWFRPAVIVGAVIVVVVVAVVLVEALEGTSKKSGTTTTTSGTTTTATDPAVADLQQVMTTLGYYTGPVDGVYGPTTAAAVKEMQTALGVTADGVYGPATVAALKGKGNDVVVQMQMELAKYGYYTGPIDGRYGPSTKAAVEKLQTDLGVTADGLFGAQTAEAFNKAVADGKLTSTTTSTSTTSSSTSATTTTTPATTAATT